MTGTVLAVKSGWPGLDTAWASTVLLIGYIAAGAIAYIGVLLALWWLAGAPDGPERHMISIAGLGWAKLRRQGGGNGSDADQ